MSQFQLLQNGPLAGTFSGLLLGTFRGFNRGSMIGGSSVPPHSGRPYR